MSLFKDASLLIVPSAYKAGKIYAVKPTNGNGDLTWTRGSDAFRTNASGLIQRVPWNLIPNSQVFSGWQKVTVGTTVTVTDNFVTAPNGTLTAAKVVFSTFSTSAQIYQAIPSPSAGVFTTSIYAKVPSGTKDILFGFFDGTIKTQTRTLTTQWQRIEYSTTLVSFGSSRTCWLYGDDGTSNVEIHIWGGQHVEGTTAQTYLPTTDRLNFPRLSYMYGSCPSVLLEPQRTNLALWSEDITSAVWLKVQLNTTANTTTSPDGTTNADTIAANGTNNDHTLYNLYTTTAGTAYTFSCYLKANTGRYVLLRIMTTGGTFRYGITFDLQTGTITQTSTTAIAPSGTSNTITNVGNGWYRISLTLTASGTQSGVIVATSNSATPTLNANLDYVYTGSESYYLYGMQLEAGAYPTTYIPTTSTTSATATRVADSFSRNNIYTNGLISASGGTWFVELRNNVAYVRDSSSNGFGIGDSSSLATNSIFLRLDQLTSARLAILKRIAGIPYTLYTTTTDTTKIAIKWNGTSADIFVNGVKEISATAFTTTNMDFLAVGSAFGVGVPIFIQQMALFPTPLSDTDCAAITSI